MILADDPPVAVAATFTTNRLPAAAVRMNQAHLAASEPAGEGRYGWASAMMSTSGCANAATGVVNLVTRNPRDSQGFGLSATVGAFSRSASSGGTGSTGSVNVRWADALSDRLELHVFRRFIDDHPMQVVTRMELEVAGSQREILLGKVLLDGFIPLRLDSPLPARLEADGRLRLQVRPGRWAVELGARHFRDITRLLLTDSQRPWPAEEIWVWDARNHLRLVEVEGGIGVDPRQTTLPGS